MRKKIGIISTPGASQAVAGMLQVPCDALCAYISDYRQIEQAFESFERSGVERIVVDDGVVGASNDAMEALRASAVKAQGRVIFVTSRPMDDPLLFQLATEAAADIFIPGIQVDASAVFTRYIEKGSDPTERSAWILVDPGDPRLSTKRKTMGRFQKRKLGAVPALSIVEKPCGCAPKLLEGDSWAEPVEAPEGPLTSADIVVPDDDDTEAGIEALLAEATEEDAEWLGNLADEMDPDGSMRAVAAVEVEAEVEDSADAVADAAPEDDWMAELAQAGEEAEQDAEDWWDEAAEDDGFDTAEADEVSGQEPDINWDSELEDEAKEGFEDVEALEVPQAEETAEEDAGFEEAEEGYEPAVEVTEEMTDDMTDSASDVVTDTMSDAVSDGTDAVGSGAEDDADTEAEDMASKGKDKAAEPQGTEAGVVGADKDKMESMVEAAVAEALGKLVSQGSDAAEPVSWADPLPAEEAEEIIPLADLLGRVAPESEKPGRGYVTAIMGARHGVGCTYLAFTLACELAACGERTALVMANMDSYRWTALTLNATPGSNEYCFKVNGVDVFSWTNRKLIRPAAYDQIVYDLGIVDLDQTATDSPAGVFKRAKLPILMISAAPWDLHLVNDYLRNLSPTMLRQWTWAVWGAGKRGKESILRGLNSKDALGPSFDRLFTVPARPDYFSTEFKPQLDMYRNLLSPVLPKKLKTKAKDSKEKAAGAEDAPKAAEAVETEAGPAPEVAIEEAVVDTAAESE